MAKYYNRILIRRAARAKLMLEGRIPKERERKRYMHESRHLHAVNRARGKRGKFDTKDIADTPEKKGGKKNASPDSTQDWDLKKRQMGKFYPKNRDW